MSNYIARLSDDGTRVQTVSEHLQAVSKKCAEFAEGHSWAELAALGGLLHDVGKYTSQFQTKINGKPSLRVDHSIAGALLIRALAREWGYPEVVARLLQYSIAGHHAGLPDGDGNENDSSLRSRLKKWDENTEYNFDAYKNELTISKINPQQLAPIFNRKEKSSCVFGAQFLIRMIFSCIVDADRLDAESFTDINNVKQNARKDYPTIKQIADKLFAHLSNFKADTEINTIRAQILKECIDAAQTDPGLFSLTVPTGGGKTLSSMAFALKHALKFGKKRVIYVIPYTSIIEQNAKVFREALDDLQHAVVEHHSNFDIAKFDSENNYLKMRQELAVENWDAPIIVTTNVQFFESFYSDKTSRARKLHNIADSVIILDEAQMIPTKWLLPCIEILRELTTYYKSTAVLCTATQPALVKDRMFKHGLDVAHEIISKPDELYAKLNRVSIKTLDRFDELNDIVPKLLEHERVLCVANTRKHARNIFDALAEKDNINMFHLSANMCPEHRTEILAKVKQLLKTGEKCRVISTQLIEAGVDIDFPVVYREIAGIDSIAQAAGRCNREGKLRDENGLDKKGQVFVFYLPDELPPFVKIPSEVTDSIFRNAEHRNNLLGLQAVKAFFEQLFWIKGDKELGIEYLQSFTKNETEMYFPFRDKGSEFRIIDEPTTPVIVEYDDDAEKLIDQLKKCIENYKTPDKDIFRKLQRYSINVYPRDFNTLRDAGAIEELENWDVYILRKDMKTYDKNFGISIETAGLLESNVY